MKKYIKPLFFILIILLSFALCACSDDTRPEDEYNYTANLSLNIENRSEDDISAMRMRPNKDFEWIDIPLNDILSSEAVVKIDLSGKIPLVEGWIVEITYNADESTKEFKDVPVSEHAYLYFDGETFSDELPTDPENSAE